MVGALWTGISGLGGAQIGLDNESNNIANVNTIGYKSSRVSFTDQMYQAKIGKGVTSFDVEKMFTQGNLKLTGVSYDVGLSGDGFFQVSNGTEKFYTRAGNFRMGESGTLEDVAKNKVQGWAISEVTSDDIKSTDPNATKFTNAFSQLLGNKIIRDSTTIETIIAKATDYNVTATTDTNSVFTGAGYKSASTKISDVELLVTEYNKLLTTHSNADPKPTASTSSTQQSFMDFKLNVAVLGTGDELYAYIDGVKYSQAFDTDEATTMKKFIDKLSDTPGFKAHYSRDSGGAYTNPVTPDDLTGGIFLEGLIPAKSFTITEFGWTDASNSNLATKGDIVTVKEAVVGTGMGAIESVEEALADAVSGKQRDVYDTTNDLRFSTTDTDNDFTYQITIYDEEKKANVTVPTTALQITDIDVDSDNDGTITDAEKSAAVDTIVTAINGNSELAKYVKAANVNGNLVVKTLDYNSAVEFSGILNSTLTVQEVQTVAITGIATAQVSFLGTAVTGSVATDTPAQTATRIAADGAIITAWNAANPDKEIATIAVNGSDNTKLDITYVNTEGDVGTITAATSNGITFGLSVETVKGKTSGTVARNIDYSGREGAGAEFLQMTTTINQTASKSDIQLRLDSLMITDSAFGEYSVDETGVITMKQDGAEFAVGQIAVAKFTDNRGLNPVGDNLFESTNRSGSALFNIDNDKTADIKGGSLELSTSDLSESLVNLMVFQKAFEANAKSITTADQILTTLIQLKR
jgi:flagellar hook protein FlgE